MANIQSAKKRIRVSELRYARNKALRTNLKTAIKKANTAIADNAQDKQQAVTYAIKRIDQACSKGILHKNTAARKKSQLAKQLYAAQS